MTLIYFILILGITVFIHEFGHFIFAKKAGIYVYEFSIGMGPRLLKFNRKGDETDYCLRLFPIGGYVSMAGEGLEEDGKIPKDRLLQSKTWLQRLLTMSAGVIFNFLLALILLFVVGLCNGVSLDTTYIQSPTVEGLQAGDKILAINGNFVNNYDKLVLELQIAGDQEFEMEVKHSDNTKEIVTITPEAVYEDDELQGYSYGFYLDGKIEKGIIPALKYAFKKFFSTIEQMIFTIIYLFRGILSVKLLSGPVGIYSAVGTYAKMGFVSLLSFLCLIDINVGFINLLPIPAFDGGHILFLIIEKIKGSPVNPKVENIINSIFFILLMILMVVITYNDIIRLF
jgi:regulator of sigma E protease